MTTSWQWNPSFDWHEKEDGTNYWWLHKRDEFDEVKVNRGLQIIGPQDFIFEGSSGKSYSECLEVEWSCHCWAYMTLGLKSCFDEWIH